MIKSKFVILFYYYYATIIMANKDLQIYRDLKFAVLLATPLSEAAAARWEAPMNDLSGIAVRVNRSTSVAVTNTHLSICLSAFLCDRLLRSCSFRPTASCLALVPPPPPVERR